MRCAQCGTEAAEGAQFCSRCGAALAAGRYGVTAASQVQQPQVETGPLYSGFWRRFAAYLLDTIILYIVSFVLAILAVLVDSSSSAVSAILILLAIPVAWLYFALQESSSAQATLGKRALGIKVTDQLGQRISFGRATGRYFGKWISNFTLTIGYLMMLFTDRKQALHDLVAGTLVVFRTVDPQAMERGHAQPVSASSGIVIAVVVACFGLPVIIGILAAIAIPVYQDYTIRAQVAQGMSLSGPIRAAVIEWRSDNERWPQDLEEMQLEPVAGEPYVERVEVSDGSVIITYGGTANNRIQGQSVSFQPVEENGEWTWRCGRAEAPMSVEDSEDTAPDSAELTTLPDKYLPIACRAVRMQ